MTSRSADAIQTQPESGFVWIWLPGATEPIVAGRVVQERESMVFRYGRSYLDNSDAIAIFEPELPLDDSEHDPRPGRIHSCLADAGPDSWGQRAILYRRFGDGTHDTTDLRPLTFLMSAGSDRIGALDFQESPTEYLSREAGSPSLADLMAAAESVEDGSAPLPPELEEALMRGTSIGGARPKALLDADGRKLIAKFGSSTDTFRMVQAEFVAMRLAHLVGLDVSKVEMTEVQNKNVLLVERFDRLPDGQRRAMVSALTVLGLDEFGGRYASYADLATIIRARFTDSRKTLRELFSRITFNILTSNTDDHARNQAAFWDGTMLTLTPAYDICPYPRSGQEAQQVMAIGADGWRYSQFAGCIARSDVYQLSQAEAQEIIDNQVDVIRADWSGVCDEAGLTQVQRAEFWERQFLNPFAFMDSHS